MAFHNQPKESVLLGWRKCLIERQKNVAEHYKNLLAMSYLSQGERNDIERRLANIEAELDSLTRRG